MCWARIRNEVTKQQTVIFFSLQNEIVLPHCWIFVIFVILSIQVTVDFFQIYIYMYVHQGNESEKFLNAIE